MSKRRNSDLDPHVRAMEDSMSKQYEDFLHTLQADLGTVLGHDAFQQGFSGHFLGTTVPANLGSLLQQQQPQSTQAQTVSFRGTQKPEANPEVRPDKLIFNPEINPEINQKSNKPDSPGFKP